MKYDLKQWVKQVSGLYGSTPFMIHQLPDELRIQQGLRQLSNHGYIRKIGREWIKEHRHHANVWQVIM